MTHDDAVLEQAIGWAVRAGDPSFAEWDQLMDWLESDPAHAASYAYVTAQAADAEDALRSLPQAINDDDWLSAPAPQKSLWQRWVGGGVAIAATIAAVVAVWQAQGSAYAVETAPGEQRIVALEGSGTVELAGGTRVLFDRHDARIATLDRGQATFTIQHDEKRPFRLKVGDNTLVDVGTVFDVRHIGASMTVAVSEGAVVFNPRTQNVRIDPGHKLTSIAGSTTYNLANIPANEVGEWREGRLTFDDASLTDVAADLSRFSGLRFQVAPGSGDRRVSGSLVIDPIRKDPHALGPLLGVTVQPAGPNWVIGAH